MTWSAQQSRPGEESESTGQILIAGIGNIFMGDDAFGCEVVSELSRKPLPKEVNLRDFGIRSYDLACALIEDYRAIILVDAVSRREAPGTLFVIEPEMDQPASPNSLTFDPHAMNVMSALQSARALGNITAQLYVVGCEPAALESADGQLGLSEPVRSALPQALTMLESLISEILVKGRERPRPRLLDDDMSAERGDEAVPAPVQQSGATMV